MIYCVDTSAWLDGWVRDYPEDVFPSLMIKCSEEVYVELEKKDDGIHDWLKSRKQAIVPIDQEIQRIVSQLLAAHPRLVDTHRSRSQADPFVIATAERLRAVVVTGEKPRGKLDTPKIPDICGVRNLRCISFLEMLRELGWKF
jgi:hypothetical protein